MRKQFWQAIAGVLLLGSSSLLSAQNYIAGQVSANQVTSGQFNISLIPLGTTAGTVTAGNDTRIGNALTINGVAVTSLTGLVKFAGGTPSNAAWADVQALTTGCSSGTPLLTYTGSCVTAGGTGSVTSVALTAPASLFTITGSPITSAGTLALGFATGQTPNYVVGSNGSGAVGLLALTAAMLPTTITSNTSGTAANVTGTVAVANGGTGATTATAALTALGGVTTAGAAAAAPVQTVAGRTGAVVIASTDVSGLAPSATTDTTNASNITSGTLPAARLPGAIETWAKYTIPYTSVSTAALTNAVTITTLATRQAVCGVVEKHSTAFAGTGITALGVTVGDLAGTATNYATNPFNVLQAVANTAFQSNNVLGLASFAGGTVQAVFTATGANLSALTAGSIDFDVCTVTLP